MNRDYDGILGFMSKNKSEWAARVFDALNSSVGAPSISQFTAKTDGSIVLRASFLS